MNKQAEEYLERVPPYQCDTIDFLRTTIVKTLSQAEETSGSGFPVYTLNGIMLTSAVSHTRPSVQMTTDRQTRTESPTQRIEKQRWNQRRSSKDETETWREQNIAPIAAAAGTIGINAIASTRRRVTDFWNDMCGLIPPLPLISRGSAIEEQYRSGDTGGQEVGRVVHVSSLQVLTGFPSAR